jgi:hypothetical protein
MTIVSAKTVAAAGISQHVITLADGVVKTMLLSKLKVAFTFVLVLGFAVQPAIEKLKAVRLSFTGVTADGVAELQGAARDDGHCEVGPHAADQGTQVPERASLCIARFRAQA